jgi:hypothetical protein
MSLLKDKPFKKCHTDDRKMIDDIHVEKISQLSESELNEYYLDNGLILDQYYRNDTKENKKESKNGILSYFKEDSIEDSESLKQRDIVKEYMCNIDDTILYSKHNENLNDKCSICKGQMCLSDLVSELVCRSCGNVKKVMIITDKISYSDPQSEITYYTYKNKHFIKSNIKYNDIREILKKLKYNKYYENIPHILSIVTGKRAPTLDRGSEEILRSLFKEIQIPFMNNCPPSRKNFLSYSYVLHKFCELLEYDHLLEYFSLLKSREKLHQQDLIWGKICNDLNWEYIPSL